MSDLGKFLKIMAVPLGVIAFVLLAVLVCARAGENYGFAGVVLMLCAFSVAAYCIGGVLVGLNAPENVPRPPEAPRAGPPYL